MTKKLVLVLIAGMFASAVFAQGVRVASFDDVKAANRNSEVPQFAGMLRDWQANLVPPAADTARSLHGRLKGMAAGVSHLQQAKLPSPLDTAAATAVGAVSPLIDKTASSLPELDYLAGTTAKYARALDYRGLNEQVTGLQTLVNEVAAMTVTVGRAEPGIENLLEQVSSNQSDYEKCVVRHLDERSSALSSSMRELNGAMKQLRESLSSALTDSGLASMKTGFDTLGTIHQSAEDLSTAIARVDSLLGEKVDPSFRYWGKTPEGRFGEVIVPLQIDSTLLLKGSDAVSSHVKTTLAPSLATMAEAYGIDWAIKGIDDDRQRVVANFQADLTLISTSKVDRLDELYFTITQTTATLPGVTGALKKGLPKVDPDSPNYGVLAVKAGFDYRGMKKQLEAFSADSLKASCR